MEVSENKKRRGKSSKGVQAFVYPSPEEYNQLRDFAERTRRSLSQAILYLALTNPALEQEDQPS